MYRNRKPDLEDPRKYTRLQVLVWAVSFWAFGLMLGGWLMSERLRGQVAEAEAGHAEASQMIVDLQLENHELVGMIDAQQAQYLGAFEKLDEIERQLDEAEYCTTEGLSMQITAESNVPQVCEGDVLTDCSQYAGRSYEALIEEDTDVLVLALHHVRSAVALIDCASQDQLEWGEDLLHHAIEAWNALELFISWNIEPEAPTG